MSDSDQLRELLQRALDGRYEIESEIGHGGMAHVFRARDVRHSRLVAIKVLRPDLAAAVGAARFLREIAVVASLDHPHIVPLFDSGETEGLPYFVMPYIAGESLDQLLKREKQLPIEEVCELTRQLALALDSAHERGIVHRDIKPQNILVSQGHVRVADFGIAQALTTASNESFTGTGVAIGSLHYMSPEQATGRGQVDSRSDIYSLGCVVYELLIGEPPFRGPTPQAIIARHSLEAVPDLRIVRDTIAPETERVVKKALAKIPADRFRTASEFATALRRSADATGTPTPVTVAPVAARGINRTLVYMAALVAVLSVALAIYQWPRLPVADGRTTGHTIAIVPFRLIGAKDPVVTAQNVAELLYPRLGGTELMQPIDPAAVIPRWTRATGADGQVSEQDALRLAQDVRAEMALLGTMELGASRITVNAVLMDARSNTILFRVPQVTGSRDSIDAMLNGLVAAVYMNRLGEGWRRPDQLTTLNLDAIKSYVNGVLLYRRGRYTEAARALESGVQRDSGFALAQIKLGLVHDADGNSESKWQAWRPAWKGRTHMSRDDSTFVSKLVWERLFDKQGIAGVDRNAAHLSYASQLGELSWVADSVPNQWEGKYVLGKLLFEWGPVLGTANPHQRARIALEETLAADSAFAPALELLVEVAASTGDTAAVRRFGTRFLAANPNADHIDFVKWRMAVAFADSSARRKLRARFGTDSMNQQVLESIIGVAQLDGVALEDARAAVDAMRDRARDNVDTWYAAVLTRFLAINMGRRGDTAQFARKEEFYLPLDGLYHVVEGTYWSGDPVRAQRIGQDTVGYNRGNSVKPRAPEHMRRCNTSLWKIANGQTEGMAINVERLRSVRSAPDSAFSMYISLCAATLDAALAWRTQSSRLSVTLHTLDSLSNAGLVTNAHILLAARVTLADIKEGTGDLQGALAVVSQRSYDPVVGVVGLSDLLLREARLSARTGNTLRATRAYRHYLALRVNATPPLDLERNRVQVELDSLVRATGQAGSRTGSASQH